MASTDRVIKTTSVTVRDAKSVARDSCTATLTRVARGVVTVRDNVKRKTVIVGSGNRCPARPKR